MTSKTQDEIVSHINKIKDSDMFGCQTGDLVSFLDYEHAKQFVVDSVTRESWIQEFDSKKNIVDYLDFAWDKANNCRGISANRSIEHFLAWIWLDDSKFYEKVLNEYENNYRFYGKDILVMISDHYKFDYKKIDDGIRSNEEY